MFLKMFRVDVAKMQPEQIDAIYRSYLVSGDLTADKNEAMKTVPKIISTAAIVSFHQDKCPNMASLDLRFFQGEVHGTTPLAEYLKGSQITKIVYSKAIPSEEKDHLAKAVAARGESLKVIYA
jgi:hypothetical protein